MDITVTGRVQEDPTVVVHPTYGACKRFNVVRDSKVITVLSHVLLEESRGVKKEQILTIHGRFENDVLFAEKIEFKGEPMNESVKLPESISDLDPSRLYWWGNAEELHEGGEVLLFDDPCCFSSEIRNLIVIRDRNHEYRFVEETGISYRYCYLLSRKPTPKYRPWKTLPEEIKPGITLHSKEEGALCFIVTGVYNKSDKPVMVGGEWLSLEYLFNMYTLADGKTPCGEEYYE